MGGVLHRRGEGEALFDGRIAIKAAFPQLSVTETWSEHARQGAEPHLHRRHVDSFYVLEGELVVLVADEERSLGPGGCVSIPAGVVHGFRMATATRYLNFHTPDEGFAGNLRARDRGEPGGFDSEDAAPAGSLASSGAVLLSAGEGERLERDDRVATIKVGRDDLALIEFEFEPAFEGPEPHTHDDHVDSFYVLEGEASFVVDREPHVLDAGSFVAAPPGVLHAFSSGGRRSRLLNLHAPSSGFHDELREGS